MVASNPKITPFLTFIGTAEEAMTFYVSLFDRSEVLSIQRYGPADSGIEGSVKHAIFSLSGQQLMCIDSSVSHEWTFTPAISLTSGASRRARSIGSISACQRVVRSTCRWTPTRSVRSLPGSLTGTASPGSSR